MCSGLFLFKWNSLYTDFLFKTRNIWVIKRFDQGNYSGPVFATISDLGLKIIFKWVYAIWEEEKNSQKQTYLIVQVQKGWNSEFSSFSYISAADTYLLN